MPEPLDVTAVVVARDEAAMIEGCLARLSFADEVIVVVDDRTTDETASLASERGALVLTHHFDGFANLKNAGIEAASHSWILVVDADERVSARLAANIRSAVAAGPVAFRVPITNYFFGQRMHYGGWTEEAPIRLFRRAAGHFVGDLHEHLIVHGPVGTLDVSLDHFSHRSVIDNLAKTAVYADVQANELLRSGHPTVTGVSLLRLASAEFLRRFVRRSGWKDGVPGIIESLYQPLSLVAVYARLWELQQDPSIEQRYRDLDARTR